MTSYGFKLFRASLRRGDGRTPIAWTETKDSATWAYRDHAVAILAKHIDEAVSSEPPRELQDLNDEEGDEALADTRRRLKPRFKLLSVTQRGTGFIGVVRYGRPGGHRTAMPGEDAAPGSSDLNIDGYAPAREYRVAFLPPKDGAGDAVIAVENIAGACPHAPLQKWTRRWSRDASETLDDGRVTPWWKFVMKPLGDLDLLTKVLAAAQAEEVRLEGAPKRDNRTRRGADPIDMRLEVLSAGVQKAVTKKVSDWASRIRDGVPIVTSSEAADVAAIFGIEKEDFALDEVTITLRDQDDIVRHVSPTSFPDVFTYWVAEDIPPDDNNFYGRVRGAIERLATSIEFETDWQGWPPGRH